MPGKTDHNSRGQISFGKSFLSQSLLKLRLQTTTTGLFVYGVSLVYSVLEKKMISNICEHFVLF